MISKLAQDETGKRQHYRPVYSLHKWWARRPGALFRALILLAAKPELTPLFKKNRGDLSPHSEYFKHHNLEDIIILDPFMGGGTTLAEANRLGAKVIGCDLNPVSFWIVRETLKPLDLEKLAVYFKFLDENAGAKIRSLYNTACIQCKSQSDSLYAFWVRYVSCPHCNEPVYLFKRPLLNKGMSRNKPLSPANPATIFCPACFALNECPGENCVCKTCGNLFSADTETYDKGYYSCLKCGTGNISLLKTLEAGQKLQEKLIAIEYSCEKCSRRIYKSPDKADLDKISACSRTWEKNRHELIFPKQKILEGTSSVRWRKHKYHYYHEIFNARQLLAFNCLFKAILNIPEEDYRNAFITVFSNSLEYNNMMTPYNYPHRKLHHLFNYHAMPLTTTPVENSVWGAGRDGAGTFINCYQRYVRAKQYCQQPFDKFKNSRGDIQTVSSEKENIGAAFVSAFEDLKHTPKGALLLCGDSSDLSAVPKDAADFVITDPPYFDSIHYSELSNFFYVWLKSLGAAPHFSSDNVPTGQEAVGNTGMDKGEAEYTHLLSAVFKACKRVLKPEGKLIFTFHHTKWRVWWAVHRAVSESGFRVADTFPVMSEYKVSPHIRNKQSLDMDLVLVCQKKEMPFEHLPTSPEKILKNLMNGLNKDCSEIRENKLFLHFMGELLKTAGAAENSLTYEWFERALMHFDAFVADIERISAEKDFKFHEFHQLELCGYSSTDAS